VSRKVLILSAFPRSLVLFRGALIREMVDAGHDVVACAHGEDVNVGAQLASWGASYHPIYLHRTGINPLADVWSVVALWRAFTHLRPDILLAYVAKPVIYGSFAARLAGVARIFCIIEGLGYAFTEGKELRRRVLREVVIRLYRASLRYADLTFFLNPDDMREFKTRRILSEGQRVLRVNGTGIGLEAFPYAHALPDQPVFLMIARPQRDKGIFEYVAAARLIKQSFPEARFRLLGGFDSNPSAISEEQVRAWQREELIEYCGQAMDVRPYLRDCTAYVLPSYREGIPRTTLEAMATGRAVITTDAPGCRETVVNGDNGFLVAPRDPLALAEAMERFITHPELAVSMGRRSRQLAEERFDVRKVNAIMLEAMGL
jgi:glycosyltransferase involved in cell wall biosynthesis